MKRKNKQRQRPQEDRMNRGKPEDMYDKVRRATLDSIGDSQGLVMEISASTSNWSPQYSKRISAWIAAHNALRGHIGNFYTSVALEQRAEAMNLVRIRNQARLESPKQIEGETNGRKKTRRRKA